MYNLVSTALEQINEFQKRGRGDDGRFTEECMPDEFVNDEGYCEKKLNPDQAFSDWGLRAIFFTTSMNATIPSLISFISIYLYVVNNNLPMPPQIWPWEAYSRDK